MARSITQGGQIDTLLDITGKTSSENGEEDLYFDMEFGIRRDDNGRSPIEYITGDTSDASEYTIRGFYNWVTHRQNAGLRKIEIRRWLGASHKVDKLISYWILPEKDNDEYEKRMSDFQEKLERKFKVESAKVHDSAV